MVMPSRDACSGEGDLPSPLEAVGDMERLSDSAGGSIPPMAARWESELEGGEPASTCGLTANGSYVRAIHGHLVLTAQVPGEGRPSQWL